MFIAEWEWDDRNTEHLAQHGVTPTTVLEVWEEQPKYRRNRAGRAGTHAMIGPDRGGAFYPLFIRESEWHRGSWRAITGRLATPSEQAWWSRS